MHNILSLLIEILIAIMVSFNVELLSKTGNYSSLVIIHVLGYLFLVAIILYKEIKIPFKLTSPILLYNAGIISVFTVMFNNLSYPVIGISLPVALGLLGQTITTLIFDHFGLLGMKKVKLDNKKY